MIAYSFCCNAWPDIKHNLRTFFYYFFRIAWRIDFDLNKSRWPPPWNQWPRRRDLHLIYMLVFKFLRNHFEIFIYLFIWGFITLWAWHAVGGFALSQLKLSDWWFNWWSVLFAALWRYFCYWWLIWRNSNGLMEFCIESVLFRHMSLWSRRAKVWVLRIKFKCQRQIFLGRQPADPIAVGLLGLKFDGA